MKKNDSKMRLWILRPNSGLDEENNPWYSYYDMIHGFVIRAESESEARKIANEHSGDESSNVADIWENQKYTTCKELLSDGDSEIIIKDSRDG